jgi:hypothetical protein
MYDALKTILPAGLWYQMRERYIPAEGIEDSQFAEFKGGTQVLTVIRSCNGSADREQLRAACGVRVSDTLKELCDAGFLIRETETLRRVRDKTKRMAELAVDPHTALEEAARREKGDTHRIISTGVSDNGYAFFFETHQCLTKLVFCLNSLTNSEQCVTISRINPRKVRHYEDQNH